MRRFRSSGWVLLCLCVMVGPVLGYEGKLGANLLDEPVLRRVNLRTVWEARLPRFADGATVEYLHRLGDELYCMFTDGRVQVLDVESGVLKWGGPIGVVKEQVSRPASWEDAVVFAVGSELRFFERGHGERIRSFDHTAPITATPLVYEQYIYFGALDQRFHAFFPEQNRILWQGIGDKGAYSRPAAAANQVFFAMGSGRVVSSRPGDRGQLWEFQCGGPVLAPLSATSKLLVVPCTDYVLYGLDAASGNLKWKVLAGAPLEEKALITDHSVYAATMGEGLYAVDPQSGAVRWRFPGATQMLAEDLEANRVFIVSDEKYIMSVDIVTGQRYDAFSRHKLRHFASNARDGYILAATDDGRVICLLPDHNPPFTAPETLATGQ